MSTIVTAHRGPHREMARDLFREYACSLPFDLDFQGFDEELAHIERHYAPPRGRLYLALEAGQPAGCVALRYLADGLCEMKRLYVRPLYRGRHIGLRLTQTAIEAAREIGYTHIRLDTVPDMHTANRIYAALGFKPIDAYRFNPVKGALFLELNLNVDNRNHKNCH